MSISRCPLFDCRSKCLLVSLLVCLNGCFGNYVSVKSFIYTTLYLDEYLDDYSVCRPFIPLRRYSVKDSGIRLNRYLFCDSRSCPNNQSCRNIQQGKTLPSRCPLTVRSSPFRRAFFRRPNGCNIAAGTAPPSEAVSGNSENFRQRFSGADFSHRQMGASCVFVRQPSVCPTKTLALRGRAFSRVERLLTRNYGYQPKTDRQDRKEAPNAES